MCQSGKGRFPPHNDGKQVPNVPSSVANVSMSDSKSDDLYNIQDDLRDMVVVVGDMHDDSALSSECVEPYVDIEIGGKRVSLLVDSGARITVLTHEKYNEVWGTRKLQPPDRSPVSYEGRTIELAGYFEDTLVFKGRKIQGKVYVAIKGLNILGWYHQGLFKMVLRPGTKNQVSILRDQVSFLRSDDFVEQLSEWFSSVFGGGLGQVKGFTHVIKVKDNAVPVKHRLRNVPFSVRDQLEQELMSFVRRESLNPSNRPFGFLL